MEVAMTANRHIFTRREIMRPKAVPGFFIIVSGVVLEHPARVFGAAGLMNEVPDRFLLIALKPANVAGISVLTPKLRINMSLFIQRSYKIVTMTCRT
jgi:hypothetical protein